MISVPQRITKQPAAAMKGAKESSLFFFFGRIRRSISDTEAPRINDKIISKTIFCPPNASPKTAISLTSPRPFHLLEAQWQTGSPPPSINPYHRIEPHRSAKRDE